MRLKSKHYVLNRKAENGKTIIRSGLELSMSMRS